MWHMVGGEHSLETSSPKLLWFGRDSVLKIFSQKKNESLNKSVTKVIVEQPTVHRVCWRSLWQTCHVYGPSWVLPIFQATINACTLLMSLWPIQTTMSSYNKFLHTSGFTCYAINTYLLKTQLKMEWRNYGKCNNRFFQKECLEYVQRT